MRIALVSPYSWTYQGGVNRHVEALAEEFISRGHEARVLAPWDPPDRVSGLLHRAAVDRPMPDYLVPLGRTFGIGANGAVSNLSPFPEGPIALSRELRDGDYDVVHVHEPAAPTISWDAISFRGAPRGRHLPRLLDQGVPQPRRDPARRAAQVQPALGADRGLRGRGLDRRAAGTAASTRSSPTASTSPPRRPGRRSPATSSGSSSSAAPRSARGCRSCSPPSRRWSSTCPRG